MKKGKHAQQKEGEQLDVPVGPTELFATE